MQDLDLLVIQEIFMTETCKYATVILPAASFLEKSGTFTNGERRVQRVNAVVKPLSGTKPDGQIMCEIAKWMVMIKHRIPLMVYWQRLLL